MYYSLENKNNSLKNFEYELANMFIENNKPPLFLCVGNSKIVDDSLGAIVGTLLKDYYKINSPVLGNHKHSLFGTSLNHALTLLKTKYYNYNIVVIDASIGSLDNLYNISLNPFGINIDCLKSNKIVGNISISSVTYVGKITNLILLNSEKKKYVFEVANYIACGIYNALKIYKNLTEKEVV